MKNFTRIKLNIVLLFMFVIQYSNAQTISQTFTSTTTFTVPAGVTQVTVEAWGGGGRGGSRTSNGFGGGGGGGAYAKKLVTVTPGNTYTVNVGNGGTNSPLDGGDSWFSNTTTIIAKGGSGVPNNLLTGGLGGSALLSIGDITNSGGNGALAVTYGGGGGSSAGPGGTGLGQNGNSATNQNGATAPTGGGNGGRGRSGSQGNGSNGSFPGGGGGGAYRSSSSTRNGGNGGNGQVIITYNVPEINIQGNGINISDGDNSVSPADGTNFGVTTVGTPISQTFTIFNTATSAPLVIGSITFSGPNPGDFSITTAPSSSISAGSSTTFVVTYTPSASGVSNATINITNNDPNEDPYNFVIRGTATEQEINIQGNSTDIVDGNTITSPADWTNFGSSLVGTGITRTFTIHNTGTLPLTIGAITFTGANAGDFSITTPPSSSIAAGSSTTFTVTFNPSAIGTRNATINISNNDSDENPYNFAISGTAVTPLTSGPGGVMNPLQLWFRSDLLNGTTSVADGSAVNTWVTQGRGSNAIRPGSVGAPVYRNNPTYNINFNSVVDFTNNPATSPQNYTDFDSSRQYLEGPNGFYTQDIFAVVIPDVNVTSTTASLDIFCGDRVPATNQTDGTGIGYGRYTNRFSNEVLTFCLGTTTGAPPSGYGVAHIDASGTVNYNDPGIINASNNSAANAQDLTFNARNVVTNTNDPADFGNVNNSQFWIGRSEGWDGSYDGRIGELITLDSRASDADRNRILSYLAIKYGITLGVNGTSINYTNSDTNIIWNATANAGYNYDIAGIGRDDISKLNQKQSKSVNAGSVLTIGLGDILATNTANTNTFTTNKSYLVWGSNGGSMTNSGAPINVDLGPTTITTITEVVNRKWKVVETGGDVLTTRISVPTAAFVSGLPALGPTDAYVMVVASNPTFTLGVETVFMSTIGLDETCLYDFDGTKYITFGVAHRAVNPLHITLDGIDDFVRIGDANELTSSFTIMTWVRPDGSNTLGTERTILSKKGSLTSGYQIVLQNDNKIRVEWYGAAPTLRSLVSNTAIPNGIWHNIAVTFNNAGKSLIIYIDGVQDKTASMIQSPATTTSMFSIGAQYIDKLNINNLWKGDIDELRMWSRVLSPTEIRFIMNQEILQNGTGTMGTIMPNTITKNDIPSLLWSNLFAYYSMNSYIGTHLDDDSVNINRGSLVIPDKVSINVQTAPMPYESNTNGLWSDTSSWKNGAIQDLAYSLSIVDGVTPIEWNIVKTNHDVESTGNKVLLGLFVDSNTLSATNDTKVEVSHYLKLNGKIDLVGKSQLVQTLNSDFDPTSSGSLERDQQGQKNKFNYNYWSSPVSSINNTTINHGYTVAGVMKDGTSESPANINWTTGLNGSATSPITLSRYWIFKFQNLAPDYANWQSVGQHGALQTGQGYTLKGSNAATPNQNYTFVGKPNNGLITSVVAANNLNLSGNPYTSALDANAFITANNSTTTGALYFWEHYNTNNSHNLSEYQGGYATRTLVGGTPPVAPAGISGLGSSTKIPNRYVPVGQGFFVMGSATGGTITYNNNQRAFVKENNVSSNTLFRAANSTVSSSEDHFTNNDDDSYATDSFKRIRLGFVDRSNYHRQILIGFMDEYATSNIDPGYDAIHLDSQPNDMYFVKGSNLLNIAGESYFNINDVFPIGVKTNGIGTVTFGIDGIENFDSSITPYIYDNVTNIYHNIQDEHFQIELPIGTINNRFSLRFTNGTTLSTDSFNLNDSINVAYNTTESMLNINNNSVNITIQNATLYNLLGQLITTWNIEDSNQQNIQLKVNNYSTGTYIVKIKTDQGEISKKIIIK